jgi:hypothetical protein
MAHKEFDIITGQPCQRYRSENKSNRNAQSYDVLGMKRLHNMEYSRSNLPKLGRPRDHKRDFNDEILKT